MGLSGESDHWKDRSEDNNSDDQGCLDDDPDNLGYDDRQQLMPQPIPEQNDTGDVIGHPSNNGNLRGVPDGINRPDLGDGHQRLDGTDNQCPAVQAHGGS